MDGDPLIARDKNNIDAAFNNVLNRTGFGWCIRNEKGEFVLASASFYAELLHVIEGDAGGLFVTGNQVGYCHFLSLMCNLKLIVRLLLIELQNHVKTEFGYSCILQ